MTRSYYYFIASLPLLDFDQPLPFPVEKFRADCERLLVPSDYQDILCVLEDRLLHGHHDLIRRMARVRDLFFQELGQRRRRMYQHHAQEQHSEEYSPYPRITELLNHADQASHPLAAEILIAKTMWHYLDELTAGHIFGMDHLLVYAFRLKILARFEEIHSSRGSDTLVDLKRKSINVYIGTHGSGD